MWRIYFLKEVKEKSIDQINQITIKRTSFFLCLLYTEKLLKNIYFLSLKKAEICCTLWLPTCEEKNLLLPSGDTSVSFEVGPWWSLCNFCSHITRYFHSTLMTTFFREWRPFHLPHRLHCHEPALAATPRVQREGARPFKNFYLFSDLILVLFHHQIQYLFNCEGS